MLIKRVKFRPPQSYAEVFEILGANGALETGFACRFVAIAGFRNFLAHDYERIDGAFVCEHILAKLDDVDEYLKRVEGYLLTGIAQ